jgi:peptidoglycan-associated lipoprotein
MLRTPTLMMKTSSAIRNLLGAACLTSLLVACGGDEQKHASTPMTPLALPLGRANMQPVAPPNTPTASSVVISEEVLRACNIPDGDAYFAFDSSSLTAVDHGPLDAVATCFTRGPMAGRSLSLVGHADPRGESDYNFTLGQSRADAVAAYLMARGVSAGHAGSTSRGAADATGHDEAGWARDRRVDVWLAK